MSAVTVCVPVFEGRDFLEATLAAIRAQTHADLRILLSVDRSGDDSLAVCRRLQAADRRITVYAQDRQLGFVENVNFLVRRVETAFFCVTPQDDLLAPDYVASLLEPLRRRGVALAYADMDRGPGTLVEFQGSLVGGRTERILGFLARQVNHVEWRGLVRSACVDDAFRFVGGENIDQALPLKLAVRGELVRVPRVLYRKTVHARSASAHQRGGEAGRLQLLGDLLDSCTSCHRLAAAALPDAGLRALARIALLLRCLKVAAIHWPLDGREAPSAAEARCFGAVLRHRIGDAVRAHRALAAMTDAARRHPGAHAIVEGSALFHLALAAEHLGIRDEAAALMRRATERDPELARTDAFHESACRRILAARTRPAARVTR